MIIISVVVIRLEIVNLIQLVMRAVQEVGLPLRRQLRGRELREPQGSSL